MVELTQPVRSLAHSPLFQVMFAWQNVPRGNLALEEIETQRHRGAEHSIAKFDLTLNLRDVDDGIVGGLEYATALFESATIERFGTYLHAILEAMVADDTQAIDRIAFLPQNERRQLLVEWNATEAAYPADRCVHELFEAQVLRAILMRWR